MSLAFDENGRPFIILREQEKKKRVKGLEAHKVSVIPRFTRHLWEKILFLQKNFPWIQKFRERVSNPLID